jgi:predicted porin
MKVKTIVLALSALAVAPVAMADVTMYGFISGAVESVSATGGSVSRPSSGRVADNNSRIGFSGNEDLGNGVKTIWQVENSLKYFDQGGTNDAGSSATFATRNSFIGLTSNTWGTVQMGYYDSAYKRLTNGGVNIMADTAADIDGTTTNVAAIFSRGEARLKNSIHYTTPLLAGFQAGASYGFDESENTTTHTSSQGHISLAANYTWQGLLVAAGWDRQNNTGGYLGYFPGQSSYSPGYVAGQHVDFSKLVMSYKFPTNTTLAAGVEHGSYGEASSAAMGQTGWTVAATQDIGNWSLRASYSKLGGLSNTTDPDAYKSNEWVLGTVYSISKTTQVLGYYARIDNSANANVDFANTPVYTTDYSSSTSASLAAGSRLSVLGIGLKKSF